MGWLVKIKNIRILMLVLTILILIKTVPAYPEYGVIPESNIDPSVIRIDEDKFLGTKVSGDYLLLDDKGEEFKLNDLMGKPLILLLSYYSCNGVCPVANSNLKNVINSIDKFKPGVNYRVLTLSFDENDDIHSAGMLVDMALLNEFSGKAWKVAVMKNKEDIKRLTNSVGYRFFWSSRDKMFIHPNTLIFLSPEGRVVRYLYGSSPAKKDVQLAITEAGFGITSGSGVTDLVNMACFSYNFKEGRYTINYPLFIGFGSLLLGISAVVVPIALRKRRKTTENTDKKYY